MRTFWKLSLPGAVLAAGILFNAANSFAKPEYTKKEKKACTYCHVTASSKELNDAGKYYAAHNHSLEGYSDKK
jgi:hypothetical protein